MTIYGYARVSTNGQTLASQNAQLHAAGCAKVYSEKISGTHSDRPMLAKLLRRLERGDVLIVDRHGLPLSVSTHAANHHEVRLVQLCFDFYMVEAKPENLIGDRAYDSDPLDEEHARLALR
jgi:hypothetical protein